jgi:hypothetical protein
MPTSPHQERLTTQLLESLLSSQESVSDELHELLWELVHAKDGDQQSSIYTAPILSWFAIHALRADGTFMSAESFAQLLAKVKYLIKSTGMIEAHRRQSNHPRGIIG